MCFHWLWPLWAVKNTVLVAPIIVLLITAIISEARSAWKGETVFIV